MQLMMAFSCATRNIHIRRWIQAEAHQVEPVNSCSLTHFDFRKVNWSLYGVMGKQTLLGFLGNKTSWFHSSTFGSIKAQIHLVSRQVPMWTDGRGAAADPAVAPGRSVPAPHASCRAEGSPGSAAHTGRYSPVSGSWRGTPQLRKTHTHFQTAVEATHTQPG